MKYLILVLALLIASATFAQPGSLFQGEPLAADDPTGKLLELFNIPVENFIWLSAFVLFMTAILKRKMPDKYFGGWKTDAFAFVISLLISLKMYLPDIQAVVVSSLACWLLPSGTFALIKNFMDGGLTDKPKETPPSN